MSYVFLFGLLILPALACLGCVRFIREAMISSKRYQHIVMALKRKGAYDLRAKEHRGQRLLDNIVKYRLIGIIALVAYGFIHELAAIPPWLYTVMLIVAFAFWPGLWILLSLLISQRRRFLAAQRDD